VLAASALLLTGCGSATDTDPGAGSPTPAPAAPTQSRTEVTLDDGQGGSVVRCWFPDSPGSGRGRLVAFVLPDDLQPSRPTPTSCSFADPDDRYRHAVEVTVGVTQSLHDYREQSLDPYVVDDAGSAGDDAVLHVEEDDAATVFDGRSGALVTSDHANDGEAVHQVVAQAGDLRVVWSVPLEGLTDPSYDDAEALDGIAGLQVVEDARAPG
jgi:hypothetical protein